MNLSRLALLAICIALPGSASAQQDRWDKPYDLKPLVPPGFQLPPNATLDAGTVGGTQTPYTTAPLQNPRSTSQPSPGLKLTIPTR